jgi:hypothetical protein
MRAQQAGLTFEGESGSEDREARTQEAIVNRRSIQYGMLVRGPDGRRIGRVMGVAGDHLHLFTLGRGRKDYTVPLAQIRDLDHGAVNLMVDHSGLDPIDESHPEELLMTVYPVPPREQDESVSTWTV